MTKIDRRQFVQGAAVLGGVAAMGPLSPAFAARNDQMNILCWEGYNQIRCSARFGRRMLVPRFAPKAAPPTPI